MNAEPDSSLTPKPEIDMIVAEQGGEKNGEIEEPGI